MTRLVLSMLAAGTLLAACQPPPASTSVSVSPTTGATEVTTTSPSAVTVAPGTAAPAATVGVTPGTTATVTTEPL